MAMEIELKAWAEAPEALKERLDTIYGTPAAVHKQDVYYTTDGKVPGLDTLRMRLSDGAWILTYKDKRIEAGTEINREHEAEISDFPVIDELLKRLGCRHLLNKEKRGWVYESGGLTIELVEVIGLGHFLEVEKVVPEEVADPDAIREELLSVLDATGVSRSSIETRYYMDMLIRGT